VWATIRFVKRLHSSREGDCPTACVTGRDPRVRD
jgi:hypothetical protein